MALDLSRICFVMPQKVTGTDILVQINGQVIGIVPITDQQALKDLLATRKIHFTVFPEVFVPGDEESGKLYSSNPEPIVVRFEAYQDDGSIPFNEAFIPANINPDIFTTYRNVDNQWVSVPYVPPGPEGAERYGALEYHFEYAGEGDEPVVNGNSLVLLINRNGGNVTIGAETDDGAVVNKGPYGAFVEMPNAFQVCLAGGIYPSGDGEVYRTKVYLFGKFAISINGNVVPYIFKDTDLPLFFKVGNPTGLVITKAPIEEETEKVYYLNNIGNDIEDGSKRIVIYQLTTDPGIMESVDEVFSTLNEFELGGRLGLWSRISCDGAKPVAKGIGLDGTFGVKVNGIEYGKANDSNTLKELATILLEHGVEMIIEDVVDIQSMSFLASGELNFSTKAPMIVTNNDLELPVIESVNGFGEPIWTCQADFTGMEAYCEISQVDNGPIIELEVTSGIKEVLDWCPAGYATLPGKDERPQILSLGPDIEFVPNTRPPSLTRLDYLFEDATNFLANITSWDMVGVTSILGMLSNCINFNQSLDWDTSTIVDMEHFLHGASKFNQDLSHWCASLQEFEPDSFATGTMLTPEMMPSWGKCPLPGVVARIVGITGPMPVGDSVQLHAFVEDTEGNPIATTDNVWSVSDPTKAIITEAGLLTILDVGEFTVKLSADGMYRHSVTVTATESSGMRGVLSGSELSIVSHGEIQLYVDGNLVPHIPEESNNDPVDPVFKYTKTLTADDKKFLIKTSESLGTLAIQTGVTEIIKWNDAGHKAGATLSLGNNILKVPATKPTGLTDLSGLFKDSMDFNDPNVVEWTMATVTKADNMFNGAVAFVQNLSMWCVSLITTAPENFSLDSGLTEEKLPVWGTCPFPGKVLLEFSTNSSGSGTMYLGAGAGANELGIKTHLIDKDTNQIVASFDGIGTYGKLGFGEYKLVILNSDNITTSMSDITVFAYNSAIISRIRAWAEEPVAKYKLDGNSRLQYVPAVAPAVTRKSYAGLFSGCTWLNDPNLSLWRPSTIIDFSYMFVGNESLDVDLDDWTVGAGTNFSYMFAEGTKMYRSLNSWDVSKGVNFEGMFYESRTISPITNWNTENAENMDSFMAYNNQFNLDLSQWCVPKILRAPNMFALEANMFLAPKHPVWGTCPTRA